MLDVSDFWQVVIFSWITGNADMHLKNFSLFSPSGYYQLTPAYDLLSTALVMPEDPEELALTLNGRKRKITRHDFETAMTASGLNEKSVANIFKRFEKSVSKWHEIIDTSFLSENMKSAYKAKIDDMMSRLVG